jgi:hypothetical protein
MSCKRFSMYIIIIVVVLSFGYQKAYNSGGRFPTWELSFKDTASGGTLILAKTRNRSVKYVSIQTSNGELANSVTQRIADVINEHNFRQTQRVQYDPHWLWVGGFQAKASGSTLILPLGPSSYILCGTETGLGIPKPPLFLSCSYHENDNNVVLRWINPPEKYDFILVKGYWTDFDKMVTKRISGTSTRFVIETGKGINIDDLDFRVIGFRDNIPSNAAAIHVCRYSQEELYGIPFTNGVAPNWASWSTSEKIEKTSFEQGQKDSFVRFGTPAKAFLTKPFYQIIKAPSQGAAHGVYRKFLGLSPGHIYRLTACLNTLDMDSVKGDWSFSLCATNNGPEGKDLTDQQLAGLAALPNGRSGPQAGRIASYSHSKTTKGDFSIVFSDANSAAGPQSSHITLPAGADTITVWVRFICSDPEGKISFSGVKLEDISANPNPKSMEQIKEQEFKEEANLIRWIERASRR